MNIPNILSILRIILIPLNLYALFAWPVWVFIIIFTITAFSDFFDGYLARRLKQESTIGAILDILADRLFIISLFIAAAIKFNIEPIYIVLLLFRDIIVFVGRFAISLVYDTKKAELMVPAHPVGKITTVVQLVLIAVIALEIRSIELIYVTISFSIMSGFYYLYLGVRSMIQAK